MSREREREREEGERALPLALPLWVLRFSAGTPYCLCELWIAIDGRSGVQRWYSALRGHKTHDKIQKTDKNKNNTEITQIIRTSRHAAPTKFFREPQGPEAPRCGKGGCAVFRLSVIISCVSSHISYISQNLTYIPTILFQLSWPSQHTHTLPAQSRLTSSSASANVAIKGQASGRHPKRPPPSKPYLTS